MSNEVKDIKAEKLYKIAAAIADGEIGDFTYCLQEGRYYQYLNGFWFEILADKFLSIIQNGIIREQRIRNKDDSWTVYKGKIITTLTPARKKQILEQFKLIKFKELHEFNTYPLINFENYMFEIEGNNVLNHSPDFYSTNRVPYKYDKFATCSLWLNTLDEIFEGDKMKPHALQEFFGYCLSSQNEQKKGLLLLGDTDTGKSTIIDIFRDVIGEQNASNVPLAYLSNPQYTPLLINKMVNIDPEVNKEAVNYEREFKLITGGKNERVSCNQKHVPTFEFVPRCKIILSANIFPRITDHSSAFYQRLLLIPCTRRFLENEKDRTLHDKLQTELPGIFNWCIEGYYRLRERGRFEIYDFMKEAVEDLEDENNPANVFLKEYTEIEMDNNSYIEKEDLYEKYKNWAKNNGQYILTHIVFSRSVYKKYHQVTPRDTRTNEGKRPRVWRNLRYVENKEPRKQQVQWQD